MPCSTCSHAVERVVLGVWHCPRCGTLKIDDTWYVPKLVGRCREFQKQVVREGWAAGAAAWHNLGIAESLNQPENRT